MQIYVSKSGQRYGPYAVEELRAAVLTNVFQPNDFASCDNGRSWIAISEVRGIGSLAYTVECDAENGLLTISYRGHVAPSDVERCVEDIRAALRQMPPGFHMLADFIALESMEVTCAPGLEKIMQLCDEKGVSTVVRIIPDPRRDIGLQIMSRFHYGPAVRIFTCKSRDEAGAILTGRTHDPIPVGMPLDPQNE